jgi:hypothetical protein
VESDLSLWDKTLTTALHQLFHEHESWTALVRWGEQHTPENYTPLGEITHHRTRQFLSPIISHLKTSKTFIFGLRVCAPDNHLSAWITRLSTRDILRSTQMELTISNSKSSSGNVITAGYILMKHPIYTQPYFYLLSLRKALPNNTPFFEPPRGFQRLEMVIEHSSKVDTVLVYPQVQGHLETLLKHNIFGKLRGGQATVP